MKKKVRVEQSEETKKPVNFKHKWMSLLYLSGVVASILFFVGMLPPELPDDREGKNCVESPQYKKLIFILLDGLRIDGVLKTKQDTLYHNNFKFLSNLDDKYKKTFLAVAGLPTGTIFRVKSILTGFPSSFMNFLQAFSANKINVDNFVKKCPINETYFYGDDTWVNIHNELRQISSTYSAYDKIRPLSEELKLINQLIDNIHEYRFNLAHFVYLDHYGHVYGLHHHEIRSIMRIYDRMIENLYENMDDTTLLVLLSDHGVNDDGSHGGASQHEISSFCTLIVKKPIHFVKNDSKEKIRREFMRKSYCYGTDWIKSTEEIDICHQDDIMPTVCALMGLKFPFYTTGNLLYEFFDSDNPFQKLLEQKNQVCEKKYQDQPGTVFERNYHLTEIMIQKFSGIHIPFLVCSLIVYGLQIAYIFYRIIKETRFKFDISSLSNLGKYLCFKIDHRFLLCLFSAIMVSHSVYSFLHEDYIWLLTFFLCSPKLNNLSLIIYHILIGKFPQNDQDRFLKIPKLADNYTSIQDIFFLLFLGALIPLDYFFSKPHIKLESNHILTLISALIKYLFTNIEKELGVSYFYSNLNLETLAFCLYKPLPFLFISWFLKNNTRYFDIYEAFTLINTSIFLVNMNYEVSSINYDIMFTFSKKFHPEIAIILLFFYVFYPPYLILKKTIINKTQSLLFTALITLHVLSANIISLWFQNDWLLYLFFGGRMYFLNGFYIFLCIYLAIMNIQNQK